MRTKRTIAFLLTLLLCVLAPILLFSCNRNKDVILPGKTLVKLVCDGETDQRYVDHNTTMELPSPEKAGYAFICWKTDVNVVRDALKVGARDVVTLTAVFERDATVYKKALTLFTEDGEVLEYDEGSHAIVEKKATAIYVNGGYKATVYKQKEYKGSHFLVGYKTEYHGNVGSVVVEKVQSTAYECGTLTDDVKAALLKKYAPIVYYSKKEKFFASTIEFAQENLTRTYSDNGYFFEIPGIKDPDFVNEYLHGQKEDAKAYAFAVEKEDVYLDLAYFLYFPYNRGKKVVFVRYGNHVGDWEHVSVRLKVETDGDKTTVTPVFVEYSAHEWRHYLPFDEVAKIGDHPEAYVAEGSHGIWPTKGSHVYLQRFVLVLKDDCGDEYARKLWEDGQMETFSYDAKTWTGKGIGGCNWKTAFDRDYDNPDSDCVYRWGNRKLKKGLFYTRFDDGPGGPAEKSSLYNYYTAQDVETH